MLGTAPRRVVEGLKVTILEILGGDLLGERLPVTLDHMGNPQVTGVALALPLARALALRFRHRGEVFDENVKCVVKLISVFAR